MMYFLHFTNFRNNKNVYLLFFCRKFITDEIQFFSGMIKWEEGPW